VSIYVKIMNPAIHNTFASYQLQKFSFMNSHHFQLTLIFSLFWIHLHFEPCVSSKYSSGTGIKIVKLKSVNFSKFKKPSRADVGHLNFSFSCNLQYMVLKEMNFSRYMTR